VAVKHYLDFELKEPYIDAAVDAATGEAPHMGEPEAPMMEAEIGKADILSGELYKLKGKIQDAYFAKIRKFINMGSYEDAEYLLNRVKGQMKEKSLAETIAQKLKSK
jgi:thioredoxin-like negative regulator of GroEL